MALMLEEQSLTSKEIMKWMVATFPFYEDIAFESFWTSASESTIFRTAESMLIDLTEALRSFELPVTETSDQDESDPPLYEMSTAGARFILRNRITVATQSGFPFLRLPAELRSIIYEMVFAYPSSGLLLDPPQGLWTPPEISLTTVTRNMSSKFSFELCDTYSYETALRVAPPRKALALLQVNKQIFAEAVSCFYRINSFFCFGADTMLLALKTLSPSRRQYLHHLALNYPVQHAQSGHELFEILASMGGLKKLDIRVYDARWLGARMPRRRHACFTVENIAGFDIFARQHTGVEVQFAGECPTIAAYWKPRFDKTIQVMPANPKKRKSKVGERKQSAKSIKAGRTSDT